MRAWFVLFGSLLLLWSATASAQDFPEGGAVQWDIPDKAHCPKDLEEAQGGSCPGSVEPFSCKYSGWQCQCQVPMYCGGAAPPPWRHQFGVMTCTPTDPKALREDGCPWFEPSNDSHCKAPPDLTCFYEPNCSTQITAICTDKRWVVTSQIVPPRP